MFKPVEIGTQNISAIKLQVYLCINDKTGQVWMSRILEMQFLHLHCNRIAFGLKTVNLFEKVIVGERKREYDGYGKARYPSQ